MLLNALNRLKDVAMKLNASKEKLTKGTKVVEEFLETHHDLASLLDGFEDQEEFEVSFELFLLLNIYLYVFICFIFSLLHLYCSQLKQNILCIYNINDYLRNDFRTAKNYQQHANKNSKLSRTSCHNSRDFFHRGQLTNILRLYLVKKRGIRRLSHKLDIKMKLIRPNRTNQKRFAFYWLVDFYRGLEMLFQCSCEWCALF